MVLVLGLGALSCGPAVLAFTPWIPCQVQPWRPVARFQKQYLLESHPLRNDPFDSHGNYTLQQTFDEIVLSRKACKQFQRYDGEDTTKPSLSNPKVVQQAYECLQLAQHAPTSFNTQPYKVILVHSQDTKKKLSRFALGPNSKRVLDSDCTAVFCADRQVLRTMPTFLRFLNQIDMEKRQQPTPRRMQLRSLLYITLFSSGYPLPRILAAPISFFVRTIISLVDFFTRNLSIYVFPSFGSAETWATKQCGMVAMTYMLACSSRGLATSPMEGINAAGIRRVLQIPSRYSIPLIVGTGIAKQQQHQAKTDSDTNITTSNHGQTPTPRYPTKDMILFNQFGGDTTATVSG